MSIVAGNWAWRQALTPTLKLVVLMVRADAADDDGVRCPSVSAPRKKARCQRVRHSDYCGT